MTKIDSHYARARARAHPIDFVVSQKTNTSPNNRHNISINDLTKSKYEDYMILGSRQLRNIPE
ncbi:MAG: hypothetical protein ACTSQH_01545 [Candidatus Hodarchaeales archaeon]